MNDMAKRKEMEIKKEIRFSPEDEMVIRLFLSLPLGDQREVKGYIRCLADCNLTRKPESA